MNRYVVEPDDSFERAPPPNGGDGLLAFADFVLPLLLLFLLVLLVRSRSGASLREYLRPSPGMTLLAIPLVALLVLYVHDFGTQMTILVAGNSFIYAGLIALIVSAISHSRPVAKIIYRPIIPHVCVFAYLLSTMVAANNTSWLGTSNTGTFRVRLWELSYSDREYEKRLQATFPPRKKVAGP